MKALRRATDRGHTAIGWLDSKHTFSFGHYRDPKHMGFRSLRVINDDRVAPGAGFGTHPHRDMEIISYVVEGALEHRDSIGTGSVIRPGEVQRMSAGSGIRHSEFNGSADEPVHFLQIWIEPSEHGGAPSYAQHDFPLDDRRGKMTLLVSPDGADGSLPIKQDARLYGTVLHDGDSLEVPLPKGRHAWVHVVRGSALLDGEPIASGDGVALSELERFELRGAHEGAELLIFDLA